MTGQIQVQGRQFPPGALVYEPFGSARELFFARESEVVLDGPAGTGKSRSILEKLNALALKYPGMRGLIVRKTRASLTDTTLVTFEDHVHPACDTENQQRNVRRSYKYSNGSELVVGGMDKAIKIMSSEYDVICAFEATEFHEDDWESMTTRLRNGVMSYQQLLADCNPAAPTHWLNQRQRRHRPPTPGPQEGSMNPKIQALMEKHGVTTLDALKAKAPAEYASVLEELMQESLNPLAPKPNPAPVPAPETGTMSLADYRALESTVVELRGTVNTLTADNLNARRDAIAITALEAARLPSAGKVKHGETKTDLDASFRTELIQTARTAENDDSAKTVVDEKIATRRGVLGQRESAPAQRPQNGLKLPAGDNSCTQTGAERTQTGQTRQFESIRSRSGLI
ncbi:phage terminase large subunit [Deinococcus sp. QL22]|uniref:phage terminase large subunit n=1 Tax=Deinococcus sp. QL22 TaxID=2939437 RepID=UPI0020183C53|nr:phage terminase large subunit [Deinococcus sp. QL22]UQN04852.1 phage terminase large subunit [Deinococcus sp. QL22]